MEFLSRCEEETLMAVYALGEDAALQQVKAAVNEAGGHDWKPQTVSTFLARLVKKGYLTGERKGRYVYYVPTVSKDEYCISSLSERNSALFKGDINAFYACLERVGITHGEEGAL